MKKTYIEPSVKAIEIKTPLMQSASMDLNTDKKVNEGSEDLIQSGDYEFEDDF